MFQPATNLDQIHDYSRTPTRRTCDYRKKPMNLMIPALCSANALAQYLVYSSRPDEGKKERNSRSSLMIETKRNIKLGARLTTASLLSELAVATGRSVVLEVYYDYCERGHYMDIITQLSVRLRCNVVLRNKVHSLTYTRDNVRNDFRSDRSFTLLL